MAKYFREKIFYFFCEFPENFSIFFLKYWKLKFRYDRYDRYDKRLPISNLLSYLLICLVRQVRQRINTLVVVFSNLLVIVIYSKVSQQSFFRVNLSYLLYLCRFLSCVSYLFMNSSSNSLHIDYGLSIFEVSTLYVKTVK